MNYGAVMTTLFVYACYLSYDNIFCVETILIIRIYFVHWVNFYCFIWIFSLLVIHLVVF